ncbi:hypothetical protein [Nocardioides sp. Leaf285]|uniref:hypothetical protein n=1 Tax=Nocardioides sp. Leaf285 TaxID=1736322 RepID=UPI0012EA78F5|nr:hypothetical protein [Nocardioides sp. Leaf285]
MGAVALWLLVACGMTEPDGGFTGTVVTPPVAAMSCPYAEFTQDVAPPNWTAAVVDVCVTPERDRVLIINVSGLALDLTPALGSALEEAHHPQPTSFPGAVDLAILRATAPESEVDGTGVVLPPGSWVIGSGSPAAVLVAQTTTTLATTYAADKLTAYVESRLADPTAARAEQVAACAQEVAADWSTLQDPSAGLDRLLADVLLGVGITCRSLVQEVADLAGDPPPQVGTLEAELTRFRTGVGASAVDDLLRLVRASVGVVR